METAIAREFRPKIFSDVLGQDVVVQALSNAVRLNKLYHAYLLCGPRGVGKTTIARILAKCVNCSSGPTTNPCNQCGSCLDNGNSSSLDVFEIDAASSSGVDNVRDNIISGVNYSPLSGRYKVYVLDEVHMLSNAAFNALLKTLEEPPQHVIFILCTTEKHKIPETIISRCQVFELKPVSIEHVVGNLSFVAKTKQLDITDKGLRLIARAGGGSIRDAQSNLDKVIAYVGSKDISDQDIVKALGVIESKVLATLMSYISKRNVAKSLEIIEELNSRGYNLKNLSIEVMSYIRAILYTKVVGFSSHRLGLEEDDGPKLVALSGAFEEDFLLKAFYAFSEAEQLSKTSANQRLQIEMAIVKCCRLI